MSILSQIIAYSPNKIDTETKAKTLLFAEVPRSEMDNFNTPDLEQSPDSFLRPGETLEDFDVEFRRPNAEGGRIPFNNGGDAVRLKALQADYDKFGKKELNKAAKTLGFKDYASMSGEENSNFRKKIKKELTEFGSALPEKESRSRSRVEKRIPKEQGIQIKLLEETNKKKFFDPEKFAKANKISMKQLKDEARKLRNNIYDKRMLVSGKEMRSTLTWIPDDLQAADNALTKMWKSKLIVDDRGKIENLFYDAFGNPDSPTFNPKKHLAIRNNLTEYYQLRDAIKAKYPNINLALDHPLSKSSLKNLFNASADQLTRVNPLEFDLNNGFKDSLSQQYELSVKNKNPNQKKAVEKIAKDLKINIGKINKDATNFNYGVKEFQKLNMKDEILKAVQNQADLSSNFKNYVKQNPDLFKTANINTNTNITKVTQGQVKQVASLLEKLGCGQSAGGRIMFGNGTTCAIKGRDILEKGLKNGFKKSEVGLAQKILGTGKFLKDAASFRGLFGPAALAFTVAAEAGLVGYDMLSTGKSFREAVGDSVFNYALGDKTKIDSVEERDKRMVAEGMTPEQMGKIKYFESMMDDMQTGFSNYDNIKDLEKKIEENTLNQKIDPQLFPDQSFQLNTQLDKAQADNQDYFRTNKVGELENYFKPREDGTIPFVQGASTLAEGLRRNELAQLQSVGNPLQSRKGDEKRSARIRELMLQNPDIRNYMGSYPTNYGFMEGGIASLNVKK